jgi:hypothetical protein
VNIRYITGNTIEQLEHAVNVALIGDWVLSDVPIAQVLSKGAYDTEGSIVYVQTIRSR